MMRASVPDETPPADLTLERAVELVEARAKGPESLGTDPDSGLPVYVMNGRFGPYVQLGENPERGSTDKPRRASLTREDSPAKLTLQRALELLSLPRLVGHDPEHAEDIVANFGRFGPYVTDGDVNASLRQGDSPETITIERAAELLAARRERVGK